MECVWAMPSSHVTKIKFCGSSPSVSFSFFSEYHVDLPCKSVWPEDLNDDLFHFRWCFLICCRKHLLLVFLMDCINCVWFMLFEFAIKLSTSSAMHCGARMDFRLFFLLKRGNCFLYQSPPKWFPLNSKVLNPCDPQKRVDPSLTGEGINTLTPLP